MNVSSFWTFLRQNLSRQDYENLPTTLNVSGIRFGRLERGSRDFKIAEVAKIAQLLDVNPVKLINDYNLCFTTTPTNEMMAFCAKHGHKMTKQIQPSVLELILKEMKSLNRQIAQMNKHLENMQNSPNDLITSKEAAKILSLPTNSTYYSSRLTALVTAKQLRATGQGRGRRFIRREVEQLRDKKIREESQ